MPQLQSITLTDRASTPVNHTLLPIGKNGNVAIVAKSDGTMVGETRLTISARRVNRRFKAALKLRVPVVATETINGIDEPKVVRTAFVNAEFTFDDNSSLQERKDCIGLFQSAFDAAEELVNDTLVNMETIW